MLEQYTNIKALLGTDLEILPTESAAPATFYPQTTRPGRHVARQAALFSVSLMKRRDAYLFPKTASSTCCNTWCVNSSKANLVSSEHVRCQRPQHGSLTWRRPSLGGAAAQAPARFATGRRLSQVSPACEISASRYRQVEPS
jgi:hypothetical protein